MQIRKKFLKISFKQILFEKASSLLTYIVKNFTLKPLLQISTYFKLLFLYIVVVICMVVSEVDFSKNFWHKFFTGKLSEKRIAFYSVRERIGENLLYLRMREVSDKMGIDYASINLYEDVLDNVIIKHFYYAAASFVNLLFIPKFNLNLTQFVSILPYGYNVLYINMPRTSLFSFKGEPNKIFQHISKYDAFVDIYSLVHGKNDLLSDGYKKGKLKSKIIIPGYIGTPEVEYKEASIDRGVITGTLWGCGRASVRIKRALERLSEGNYIVGYGLKDIEEVTGINFKGKINSIDDLNNKLIEAHREHGIALIVHNLEHAADGIPTSRIAEAVSGGALIISDNHLFLKKYFGNNVLYFDSNADEETIYNQIKSHIEWARNNKSAARMMAKKSYEIFNANFTLEKQLKAILDAFD